MLKIKNNSPILVFMITVLVVIICNYILHLLGVKVWITRLIYAVLFYYTASIGFFCSIFAPNNELVTDRVRNKLTRIILSVFVRGLIVYLFYLCMIIRTLPITIDITRLFGQDFKIAKKEVVVSSVSSSVYGIETYLNFEWENEHYTQVFAFEPKPKIGDKIIIAYLKESRLILETKSMR